MRFGRSRVVLISVLVIVCWGVPIASGQQSAKPLTEKELIFLLEKRVSASALANMVQSFGVTFQPNAELLDRLKKAGATDALLETIKRKALTLNLQVDGTKSPPATPEAEAIPLPARQHLQLGQQKLKNSDYEGALQEFAEAERIRPQWDQVFNQRGLALAALGRYSEAASEWKKLLASAPADADRAAIQQKITEWESAAERVAKMRALLSQGDQQLLSGDAKGAAQSFRDAVGMGNSVGALLALARAQLLDGDYNGLAETARQAQALDPQSAFAALYLADAELRQGRPDSPALTQGLNLNPNLVYGRALLAREFATKAGGHAQVTPGGASAPSAEERNRRGWVLWNGGYFQLALEELHKATLLNPMEAGWQCDLAYARIAQRDTTGALAAAREAVRLNSESVCGHHVLALSLESSGKHDQATLEFQAAQKLSSGLGMESLLRPAIQSGGPVAPIN